MTENIHTERREYLDKQRDDWEGELEQFTMAVYVIRKEGGEHHEPPADIGVVIEGVKVLNELPSFTSACALLLGMIYIINLAYPKPLRFTFENAETSVCTPVHLTDGNGGGVERENEKDVGEKMGQRKKQRIQKKDAHV
ncbi:hypothetical protein F2P79_012450 [Pimephales promelas]|nr:hypothetical protein F2P79_012450 [Pimephales promelas]